MTMNMVKQSFLRIRKIHLKLCQELWAFLCQLVFQFNYEHVTGFEEYPSVCSLGECVSVELSGNFYMI